MPKYKIQGRFKNLQVMVMVLFAVFSFSLGNIIIIYIIEHTYYSLATEYGIYLPLWLDIIIPSILVVAIYPVFGLPIARAKFRNPMSQRAILIQGVLGLCLFPVLAILSVIIIIYLAKLASPLSGMPIVGTFIVSVGGLIPSYRILFILVTTPLSAVLGVWCSLGIYWVLDRYGGSR